MGERVNSNKEYKQYMVVTSNMTKRQWVVFSYFPSVLAKVMFGVETYTNAFDSKNA
jgi:hypothetical protein